MRCAMKIEDKFAKAARARLCPQVSAGKSCVPDGMTETFTTVRFVPICQMHLDTLNHHKKLATERLNAIAAGPLVV